ncbi:flagellin lysine-N-methylase [Pelosinus propionicus]|uniref:Lysine-N-methylase n=1 Tax=Pelosinus propionicus DSM 13327 TaxID=1123291 RepID=A0A1I4IIC0_9FIRM|nr:flagellin lysine-N-methylase [Pelosinus propionicus]SFL53817.1 lysine-N-methylase [Pelosinus propionicus DSM 13327]
MYIYIDIINEFTCEMCGSCCRNDWQVTMDEESYRRNYQLFLRNGKEEEFFNIFIPIIGKVELGEYAYIRKKTEGGCWFLEENHLCRLHQEAGHNHLDTVCQIFPRYPMNTSRGKELTLSFSCPAVVKIASRVRPLEIIRSKVEPMLLHANQEVAHVYPDQQSSYHPLRYYFEIEHHIIDLLQYRKITIEERIQLVKETIKKILHLPQNETFKQSFNTIIYDNYLYLDEKDDVIAAVSHCTPDILIENFLINFVFKKPLYLYGLQSGLHLLDTMWRQIKSERINDTNGSTEMERISTLIMNLEFHYSHNRSTLLTSILL